MAGLPDIRRLSELEEQSLANQLEAARAAVTHPGAKGDVLEDSIHEFVRQLLPAEYGVSSGFVAWVPALGREAELSPQMDVIIFDAQRCSPLKTLGKGRAVYPLEGVLGYIEVKASILSQPRAKVLKKSSIEAIAMTNQRIRTMKRRVYGSASGGSPSVKRYFEKTWLGLRSYLIAFDLQGGLSRLDVLAQRLSQAQRRAGTFAHFHGVLVPNRAWLTTLQVDASTAKPEDWWRIHVEPSDALLRFRNALLEDLATFPRPSPGEWAARHHYAQHLPTEGALLSATPQSTT